MITRRHMLLGTAGIAGAAVLAACGTDDAATTPAPADTTSGAATDPTSAPASETSAAEAPATVDDINVGYIEDGNGCMLVAVAETQDLWEKHGLKANTLAFTNGPLQIQALGTGDLDFGYIGFGALWLPMSDQAKVVSINSRGTADRVIAQPGITSMAELKGKKVGVPEGTSGDMLLNLALEEAGMTIDDIERIPMDPPTTISAFASKQIDAAGIWYPHVETIKNQVPDLVEVAKSTDFADLAFLAAQVAGTDIQDRPEVLAKFQAVCKEAFTWAAANREELNGILADFIKAPADAIASEQEFVEVFSADDVIAKNDDGTIEAWLTGLNEEFVKAEKAPEVVPVGNYWLAEDYAQA
ncbi:aliphatic sulfonate ABC transporter substrate-binding protein [Tessaracoccus sp. MC1756]|uniref:aliphatic sulfonate ABC transporter substrate-binding protein n=1 Tax=Tessaracoccus sp. MC1756 TaxID=2760311 RepID=UPI0021031920|nr:aliphatic sulfonate ABC transporter substrate-binding protein [Tessaracoccus sp. MC1756]